MKQQESHALAAQALTDRQKKSSCIQSKIGRETTANRARKSAYTSRTCSGQLNSPWHTARLLPCPAAHLQDGVLLSRGRQPNSVAFCSVGFSPALRARILPASVVSQQHSIALQLLCNMQTCRRISQAFFLPLLADPLLQAVYLACQPSCAASC